MSRQLRPTASIGQRSHALFFRSATLVPLLERLEQGVYYSSCYYHTRKIPSLYKARLRLGLAKPRPRASPSLILDFT